MTAAPIPDLAAALVRRILRNALDDQRALVRELTRPRGEPPAPEAAAWAAGLTAEIDRLDAILTGAPVRPAGVTP